MKGYLTIDFGGTRTRAAFFNDQQQLIRRVETLTRVQDGQAHVIRRLIEIGKAVLSDDIELRAIGVAAPGPLDAKHGVILRAETLPGWRDVPLAALLSEAFGGVPTYIQNDGNLGALAEYHLGAGQGADPMIYMTISTGIGGGAIVNGRLFTGANALAIEPGHMRFTLPDGTHRRLEELASGTALGYWAQHHLQHSDVPSSLRAADVVDGKSVGQAAVAGDALALRVVGDAGRWLGLGFVNLLHLFNPNAIVLGGSVIQLGNLLLAPAIEVIQNNILTHNFYSEKLIRYAKIKEDMCLYGALMYCSSTAPQWKLK